MQQRTTGLIAVLISALVFGFIGGVLGARWAAGNQPIAAAAPSRPAALVHAPDSFSAVAAAITPTVVNIDTVYYERRASPFESLFGQAFPDESPLYQAAGGGSGFIVRQDGLVLTNQHVIEKAQQIVVTLADGRKLEGRVVGGDRISDLAVVKIEASRLPVAPLGDSSAVRPGDWAIAIGNPFGFDHTVTAGVISALGRPIQVPRENRRYPNLIQTDASINQGNSGGPLVNTAGEVIGINTAIVAPGPTATPIGFAIPIDDAKQVVKELVAKGKVSRSWIGIGLINVTPQLSQAYSLPVRQGLLVRDTVPDGPASQAGLQRLDIIESLGGKPATDRGQVLFDINTARVGSVLKLKVWRLQDERWHPLSVTVTTAEMPES